MLSTQKVLTVTIWILCLGLGRYESVIAEPNTKSTTSTSLTNLFPTSGEVSAALHANWRTHLQPARKMPEGYSYSSLTLAIPGKADDIVDEWIKRIEKNIKGYKLSLKSKGNDPVLLNRLIENNQKTIDKLNAERATRDSWSQFAQTIMNEPKKSFTIEILHKKDLPKIDPKDFRRDLCAGGSDDIALKEHAFQTLNMEDNSAYGIITFNNMKKRNG